MQNTSVVESRASKNERRYKVHKLNHMRKIPRKFSDEVIFFDRELASNFRISNAENMGQVGAFKAYIVKRIQVRPAMATSEADIALLLQHCVLELKVGGDEKAIQLPLQDAPPASGLGPNTGIPMIGSPEPRGSFDIGTIRIAGQEPWSLRIRTPKTLYFAEAIYLDVMIEMLLDQRKG